MEKTNMSEEELQNLSLDDSEQLVVFQLANEYYGVDIGAVNTIIRMENITDVPRTPEYVEGVINLRGSIIPVVNMRKRFGMPLGEDTKASRIVVVESSRGMIGIVVDAVAETLRLASDSIEPPSSIIDSVDTEYLRGVGKCNDRLVILLDIEKVFSAREMDELKQVEKKAQETEAETQAA